MSANRRWEAVCTRARSCCGGAADGTADGTAVELGAHDAVAAPGSASAEPALSFPLFILQVRFQLTPLADLTVMFIALEVKPVSS